MVGNSPKVWDEVWTDPGLESNFQLVLETEAASLRWQKVSAVLISEFGSLKNLKVLELGAGIGTYAGLMAKQGAKVTVLDYSDQALQKAKAFFKANQLKAQFIKSDALRFPKNLVSQFDISISVGLTEHFTGLKRLKIHQSHLKVLRKGGLAVFLTPNSANLPYRIYTSSLRTATVRSGMKFTQHLS